MSLVILLVQLVLLLVFFCDAIGIAALTVALLDNLCGWLAKRLDRPGKGWMAARAEEWLMMPVSERPVVPTLIVLAEFVVITGALTGALGYVGVWLAVSLLAIFSIPAVLGWSIILNKDVELLAFLSKAWKSLTCRIRLASVVATILGILLLSIAVNVGCNNTRKSGGIPHTAVQPNAAAVQPLSVEFVKCPDGVVIQAGSGGKLPFSFQVTNNERHTDARILVHYVLADLSGWPVVCPLPYGPVKIDDEEHIVVKDVIPLPASVAPGSYRLYVKVTDQKHWPGFVATGAVQVVMQVAPMPTFAQPPQAAEPAPVAEAPAQPPPPPAEAQAPAAPAAESPPPVEVTQPGQIWQQYQIQVQCLTPRQVARQAELQRRAAERIQAEKRRSIVQSFRDLGRAVGSMRRFLHMRRF